MVIFKSKNFSSDSLSRLKELRKAGSLCDINLTVDQHAFKAHRCVLVARSQYFNSLFLGQFKEASTQNVDLSEVTTDVEALEHVLDFLYSGEIDIEDDSLEILVKLSTYLVIDPLRKLCIQYIEDQLNLKTCLRYFLFAASYGLTEIETKAKLYLTSRLHDSYKVILEENLELSPDDVSYMLKNGIFQHCTPVNILYFVFKWLTDIITDQHAKVASQILDTVDHIIVLSADLGCLSEQLKSDSLELLARIQEAEQNNNSCDAGNLLEKMRKLLEKVFPELKLENKVYNLRAGPSSAKKRKDSLGKARPESSRRSQHEDVEAVIITISPRQSIVDADLKGKADEVLESYSEVTHTEPILNLCCYTPTTKTWYHITEFNPGPGEILKSIFAELYLGNIRAVLFKEELVLMGQYAYKKVYFYNLRTNSLRETMVPDTVGSDLQVNEVSRVHSACLESSTNTLYLILENMVNEEITHHETGKFFSGLKLDGEVWVPFFETSIFRDGSCPDDDCELQAKVSTVSNELIFTHGLTAERCTYHDIVFIVNLNEENPVPVNIYNTYSDDVQLELMGYNILETQSHFYILFNFVDPCDSDDVCHVYKYEFNSLCVEKGWQEKKSFKMYQLEHVFTYSTVCFTHLTASSGKNVLLYEGDKYSIRRRVHKETENEDQDQDQTYKLQ